MLKITLRKDGKDVEFKQEFVPAKMIKDTIKFEEKVLTQSFKDDELDELDEIVNFIVKLYGNQFSSKEFWEGFNLVGNHMLEKIICDIGIVLGKTYKKINEIPVDEDEKN